MDHEESIRAFEAWLLQHPGCYDNAEKVWLGAMEHMQRKVDKLWIAVNVAKELRQKFSNDTYEQLLRFDEVLRDIEVE